MKRKGRAAAAVLGAAAPAVPVAACGPSGGSCGNANSGGNANSRGDADSGGDVNGRTPSCSAGPWAA